MATQLDRLLAIPEISDSTDFPDSTTAPGLRTLDDALRCDICRDFYDAPVSLNCGHSFCSVCIRSALPVNSTCPSCRKDASEIHLRKNAAVESAVQAWRIARPLILRLANEEHARKTCPVPLKSTKTHLDEPARKRKRSGSPVSASDDDPIVLSSSPAPSGSATPDALPGTVDCPICQKAVLTQKINIHIDSDCKRHLAKTVNHTAPVDAKGKQKQQWSKLLGGAGASTGGAKGKEKGKGKVRLRENEDDAEPEHLPKVAYDIHPQKRIVELLNEWGLSTHGEKNALIKRHSRWIVLYNANVDRAPENRKTIEQLRIDLRRAEEAEQKTRKEVVDDPVAYQKANKSTFAKLTEAARPKKAARTSEEAPTPIGAPPPSAIMDLVEEATPPEVVEID
ncbi:E3 ubiquitin-protein ligase RAD18 [Trametes versicolor FP-101664 SS1]|uniref:E3 ubiquitin-protein ligase RAD18 n=1 Tax=Trametes versicolor (strain FP-101664) TaxID=717944 RepID=UPI0004622063|nr:E3 ubiquitin-protein ligase RAD18 [Trametes versicolor FP-101664 SS1]EIW60821.1 hypothetical protein TRAVEDRAFT_46061 [Trametes versicolor FP-101664 SS1]